MYLKQMMVRLDHQGAQNYYPTVIQNKSQYIYWGSHENDAYDVSANQQLLVVTLQEQ